MDLRVNLLLNNKFGSICSCSCSCSRPRFSILCYEWMSVFFNASLSRGCTCHSSIIIKVTSLYSSFLFDIGVDTNSSSILL